MRLFPGRLDRALNQMELALAVLIFGLVVWVLQDRIERFLARSEQVWLEATRAGIQSGLNLVLADRLLRGDRHRLAALHLANPFALRATVCKPTVAGCAAHEAREESTVLTPPPGYRGALAEQPPDWQPGQWYFNTRQHTLEYRIRNWEFVRDAAEPVRARYQVQLQFVDRDGDGRYGPGDTLQGLTLQPVEPLHWLFEGP